MHGINIQEKNIEAGLFQFIYPFSIENGLDVKILSFLHEQDFTFFRLDHLEDEETYYGDFKVSHRQMEAYFLSFTNKVLFPHSEHPKGIKRYSKALNLNAQLKTDLVRIPFHIPSIDVILCPYELGFLLREVNGLPLWITGYGSRLDWFNISFRKIVKRDSWFS